MLSISIVIDPLVKALKDPSFRIKKMTLRELGIIGGLNEVVPIQKMLKDESERIREEVRIALQNINILKK